MLEGSGEPEFTPAYVNVTRASEHQSPSAEPRPSVIEADKRDQAGGQVEATLRCPGQCREDKAVKT